MFRDTFKTIFQALAMLALIIFIGTVGFYIIEDFDPLEAFFMTIITVSTVGFGTLHSLSDGGMVFTAFLIIFSFGIFAYVVSAGTRLIFDGEFRNYLKTYTVEKKISKMQDHVIICGYGRNGKQAAIELSDNGVPFLVIEKESKVIEAMHENPELVYIEGDATQEDTLQHARIEQAKALITTFPNDAENLFVVLTAREMNPDMIIISRAYDEHTDTKIKRAGATNVIMPDRVGGQRMAKLVMQPDVVEFLEFIMLQNAHDVMLEEVSCDHMEGEALNKSIRDLDVRNTSGANIVGLKTSDGAYVINPKADFVLSSRDKLFVLGKKKQIEKLKEIMRRVGQEDS